MTTRTATPRQARIAVSALFFINGALIASVLPRLPAIKANLDLSNTALGLGIAFGPAGALLASTVAGLLVTRFGSGRLAVGASALYGITLSLVGLAPVWAAFAAAVFLYGACDGLADVSQNAHGLRVQQKYGRSLINGFHAWWSIGGVAGGATSAAAAALHVPLAVHLGVVGGILAAAALVVGRWTLPGPDPGRNDVSAGMTGRRLPILALAGVAALTLMAAVVEDVPGTWGAVYLREEVGTSAGLAALAFAAFTAGMTGGRLVADRAVDRWGHVAVVRTGALIAAVGLSAALLVGNPAAGLIGFGLVGVGASPGFPALFHAAGHRPGVRPADGVALVSWAARAGFLVAPPAVGLFADATSLTWAVGLGVGAALAVLAGAAALRTPADS
ncbi:MAG TPA: MFS transporter [Jiangellaceae bacterium]